MVSLVGAVCVEMPKMKGCEAWLALCKPEGSVVGACKSPGVAPEVMWTYETKAQVRKRGLAAGSATRFELRMGRWLGGSALFCA